ncbi:unnamed protein product, partial [Didymodactylos carnosus]
KCNSSECNQILSIADGTSFGYCFGYCTNNVTITSSKLIGYNESRQISQYSPLKKEFDYPLNNWKVLLGLVNIKKFISTNNTLGCPDCADGGAEYIEIQFLKCTKRVTFEYGRTIPDLDALVKKLRNIRIGYLKKLRDVY